jgi:hypothetical protein
MDRYVDSPSRMGFHLDPYLIPPLLALDKEIEKLHTLLPPGFVDRSLLGSLPLRERWHNKTASIADMKTLSKSIRKRLKTIKEAEEYMAKNCSNFESYKTMFWTPKPGVENRLHPDLRKEIGRFIVMDESGKPWTLAMEMVARVFSDYNPLNIFRPHSLVRWHGLHCLLCAELSYEQIRICPGWDDPAFEQVRPRLAPAPARQALSNSPPDPGPFSRAFHQV